MISGKDLADVLDVAPSTLSEAAKNGHYCAGHNVSEWAVRSPSGRLTGYDVPVGVLPPSNSPDDDYEPDEEELGRFRELVERTEEGVREQEQRENPPNSVESSDDQDGSEILYLVGGLGVAIGIAWLLSELAGNTSNLGNTPTSLAGVSTSLNSPITPVRTATAVRAR